ncbi:MAG: glycosyltransferase [Gammaproteobacteria bacterium]|nr:glycosyltransferase [Gammaproteobacteria bacterium]
MTKPTVMVFASYYLPGYKAGGPIRSIANMIQHLENEFHFFVLTRDRDLGEAEPYSGIEPGKWILNSQQSVYYIAPRERTLTGIRNLIFDLQPDILYFNSFLDFEFTAKTLILRRIGLLPKNIPLILAPRGELSSGALALKSSKKHFFIQIARLLGLYRNLIWQASSVQEENDIRAWWGKAVEVCISPNLAPKFSRNSEPALRHDRSKTPGKLRIVVLSRVARNKNITGALRILKNIKTNVEFTIYGPIEDKVYWRQCQDLIQTLPQNVSVRYQGEVNPQKVISVLSNYELFFFPTHGENFGHVILEALMAGCPLLLSDQTPWRDLSAKKIGFDIPLNRPDKYEIVIEQFAAMSQQEFYTWSCNARDYGLKYVENPDSVKETRRMLEKAMTS